MAKLTKFPKGAIRRMARSIDWLDRLEVAARWAVKLLPFLGPAATVLAALLEGLGATFAMVYGSATLAFCSVATLALLKGLDLIENRRPRIRFGRWALFEGFQYEHDRAAVVVRFPIINTGHPTSFSEWRAWIKPRGGRHQKCDVFLLKNLSVNGISLPANEFHNFPDLRLEKGDKKTRNLLVVAPPGVTKKDMVDLGTAYKISMVDVYGQKHTNIFPIDSRAPNTDVPSSFGGSPRSSRPSASGSGARRLPPGES